MELAYRARSGRAGQVKDIMPRRPLAHAIIRHLCLALRPLSGKDQAVQDFFAADGMSRDYLKQVMDFIDTWLPRFESETRSYLTVAFGCTGGRHRSVYFAETLAKHCNSLGRDKVMVYHRELE